jgi:hypothetical protein
VLPSRTFRPFSLALHSLVSPEILAEVP